MNATQPLAYSYIRFSHPDQAKGDSLRRQTAGAAKWCKENGVVLDTSITLHDLGQSAYLGEHRSNPDRHALAAFLKMVEEGRIEKDSYFVLENLDRLSREHVRPATLLLLNLLEAGINVVTLVPAKTYRHDSTDMTDVILAVVELARGHSESAAKSVRVGAKWGQRRKAAREGKDILTRRVPAWCKIESGKIVLDPEKASAVRRIYELATTGHGHALIVKKLTSEKVAPIGTKKWSRSYVAKILTSRTTVGELQPKLRDGTPDGDLIEGYYPAVVDEQTWQAARAAVGDRRNKPSKETTDGVNVWTGLIEDGRTGTAFYSTTRVEKGVSYRVLQCLAGPEGKGKYQSFPQGVWEQAILAHLKEINPADILPPAPSAGKVGELKADLKRVVGRLEALQKALEGEDDLATVLSAVRALEGKRDALALELRAAEREVATPITSAWSDLRDALANAVDQEEAKLRLRSALRRVVEKFVVRVLVRGKVRVALVDCVFKGTSQIRTYAIYCRQPRANASGRTAGCWWSRSHKRAETVAVEADDDTMISLVEAWVVHAEMGRIKDAVGGVIA